MRHSRQKVCVPHLSLADPWLTASSKGPVKDVYLNVSQKRCHLHLTKHIGINPPIGK